MSAPTERDFAYQDQSLQGVSRTFALTIPQLPQPLRTVVSNAYLLCRIADTIEDDSTLTPQQQQHFAEQFIAVVEGSVPASDFAYELHPLLSRQLLDAERDLVAHADSVIRVTHSFNTIQRQALARCIRIMARGMADYQKKETLAGLADLDAMGDYCYYVAGVVGEMLTELFCDHLPGLQPSKPELMKLAVSFGQGLQMTNILKDTWEDRTRGACWLPRDVFLERGLDLRDLQPGSAAFEDGLAELIGVTRGHLQNALTYTLAIPSNETGIRRFCLWAIGMAVLTLRKINRHRDFRRGAEVKISRRSVAATIGFSNLLARHDTLLKLLFTLTSRDLPNADFHEKLSALTDAARPHSR